MPRVLPSCFLCSLLLFSLLVMPVNSAFRWAPVMEKWRWRRRHLHTAVCSPSSHPFKPCTPSSTNRIQALITLILVGPGDDLKLTRPGMALKAWCLGSCHLKHQRRLGDALTPSGGFIVATENPNCAGLVTPRIINKLHTYGVSPLSHNFPDPNTAEITAKGPPGASSCGSLLSSATSHNVATVNTASRRLPVMGDLAVAYSPLALLHLLIEYKP